MVFVEHSFYARHSVWVSEERRIMVLVQECFWKNAGLKLKFEEWVEGTEESLSSEGNVIICRASKLHQLQIIVRSIGREKVGVKLQCVLMI